MPNGQNVTSLLQESSLANNSIIVLIFQPSTESVTETLESTLTGADTTALHNFLTCLMKHYANIHLNPYFQSKINVFIQIMKGFSKLDD